MFCGQSLCSRMHQLVKFDDSSLYTYIPSVKFWTPPGAPSIDPMGQDLNNLYTAINEDTCMVIYCITNLTLKFFRRRYLKIFPIFMYSYVELWTPSGTKV